MPVWPGDGWSASGRGWGARLTPGYAFLAMTRMWSQDDAKHAVDDTAPSPAASSAPTRPARARHRRRRWVVLSALGAVVVALVVGGWQLWQLGSDLLGLRDAARMAQQHVQSRDMAELPADLARARALAARADADAGAPVVAFAAGLPWVGDDVNAVRELAGVANDLASASTSIDPLVARVASGGSLGLQSAAEVREAIAPVRTATAAAAVRLGRLDLSGLFPPISDNVSRLRDALGNAGPAIDRLTPYLNAVSIFSSPGGAHTWFVAMQNLGESRPSGGMIGSWLLVRTSDGEIEVLKRGVNDELDTTQKVDYSRYLPAGYRQVWGDSLDNWRSFTLSANFPDNARMLARTWNLRGEEQADGVLALGQGTVRFLAAATGAVQVGGRTIAASDLADYLTVGVYRDYPDPKAKDAAVTDVIAQILDKLSAGRFDLAGLYAAAITDPVDDYLQLWSSDRAVQKQIKAAGVSGSFTDEGGPVASVRLADGAANKMDAFVHLGAEYRLGACTVDDGGVATRHSTFTVALRNSAPDGLPDYMTGKGDLLDGQKHLVGSTRDFVIVYPPVQATVTSALSNGQPALAQSAWVGGRDMLVFDVKLEPGESTTIQIAWDEFPTDANDKPYSLTPRIVLPPLANPADISLVAGPACP